MLMQKQYDTTVEEETRKHQGTAASTEKEPVMLKKILECPNCTSLLRAWYQSTVTKITCPKCWTEIPIDDPKKNRFDVGVVS